MYVDYLEHHGIKGMKWGVRKDQYPRKAIRGAVNSMSSLKKKVDQARVDAANKKIIKDANKLQTKHQKELSSKSGRAARRIALSTHDPRKLAKYQNYLNDDELRSQYTRLSLENDVRELAAKRRDSGWKKFQQRATWAMNSPVGKEAIKIGSAKIMQKLGLGDTKKKDKDGTEKTTNSKKSKSKIFGSSNKYDFSKRTQRNSQSSTYRSSSTSRSSYASNSKSSPFSRSEEMKRRDDIAKAYTEVAFEHYKNAYISNVRGLPAARSIVDEIIKK